MKKFFITLMCIVMVVCFMPTVALAGETDLASIIDNAKTGDTVTLSSDVTVNESISIKDKNITIDLAEKTITTTVPEVFAISGDANVTITGNGQIKGPEGEDAKKHDGKAVIGISGENAKLTVLNGTITAGGVCDCGMYGIYVRDGGTVELGDSSGGPTISTWCAAVGENFTTGPANIIINGGIYTEKLSPPAEGTWWSYFCAPIYAASSGTITINGGTFNGYYGLSSRYEDATQKLTINGGTFNGTKSALLVDTQKGAGEGTTNREISITGGTFSSDVSAYVPEGTKVVSNDGKFTLAPNTEGEKAAKAQVGDAGFTTLEAAIAAAEDGDTVTLLVDVETTAYTEIRKNLTIDLGGHTFTSTDGGFDVYSNLTLKNGTINTLKWGAWVQSGAKLVVEKDVTMNATSTADDKGGIMVQDNGSEITLRGKVTAAGGVGVSGRGNKTEGGVIINIEPDASVICTNTKGAGIYFPNTAQLNIKGSVTGATGIYAKCGTTTIFEGAEVTATGNKVAYQYYGDGFYSTGDAIAVDSCNYPGGTPKLVIQGGTITATKGDAVNEYLGNGCTTAADMSITGGTFSTDPKAYVPANSNYRVRTNSDGTYTVYHYTPYVPSIPTDSLKAARTEAIKAVSDYVNAADYEEAQQAEIKTIVDNAKKDIEAAKTADEIKAIEAAAKAELDKLETAEEMALIRTIEGTQFTARSKATTLNGKKAIRVTWNKPADLDFDGYEIYRSTERYKGYGTEPFFTTTNQKYTNNKGLKVGKTYYYKVRGFKYVNDEKVYTEYSLKAWRTVK